MKTSRKLRSPWNVHWVLAVGISLAVGPAGAVQAAISVVNDADSEALPDTNGDGNPYKFENVPYTNQFNAGATADKLIVTLCSETGAGGPAAVSYNGVPLEPVAGTSAGRMLGVWYLDTPYTGGAADLIVNMTNYTVVNGLGLGIVSISGSATGVAAVAAANATNEVTITPAAAGSLVVAAYGAQDASGDASPSAPLIALYEGANIGSADGAAAYETGVAASPRTYSFSGGAQGEGGVGAAAFTPGPDTTPPAIASFSPIDGSSNAFVGANLVASFTEDVALTGSGTVTIANLDAGTQNDITLPDGQVTVSGTDLTINPTEDLGAGSNYAVRISADAVVDLVGLPFAGMLDNTTWNFLTTATPTYTWIQGGDPSVWTDPANWLGAAVPPPATPGLSLVFSASTSGQIGESPAGAKVTFGSLSVSSSFDWRSFGTYSSQQTTGIFVDSGTNTPAIVTLSGGAFMSAYYVPWNLDSDLELVGNGGIQFKGYSSSGVNGPGGVIINANTRVACGGTHGSEEWAYTGGVTVRSGGRFITSHSNGQLGDGRVAIEEGGWVVAQSGTMDQDVSFVLTSDGASPAANNVLITASPSFTGQFNFDVTGVTPTAGNQWQIVNATATYGAGFSIAGFTEDAGVWSGTINRVTYSFDESSGVLAVVSIPARGTVLTFR